MTATLFSVCLLVIFTVETAIAAAPGSLDPTFGISGKVSRIVSGNGTMNGTAVQPDGKVIIAGGWQNGATRDFLVVRLNADGSNDSTFGAGGIVFTDFAGNFDDAYSVVVQADGKIVVAGSSGSGFNDCSFARYLQNGSLDTTFDGDGRLTLGAFPGQIGDRINKIVTQPDGKILGAGRVDTDFLLVRVNLDGSLDQTFGSNGIVVTNSSTFADNIRDLAILPDGKIVAAGGSGRCTAAKYHSNGSLDTAFGSAGLFISNFGYFNECSGMAVQTDGKVVLSGVASPEPQFSSLVARLNSTGTIDTTFGSNGLFVININPAGADSFSDVIIESSGKIIASGSTGEFPNYDFAVARFSSSGLPDQSFANNGVSVMDIGGDDVANISVAYGDKLLVVGDAEGSTSFKAARYNLTVTPIASSDFDGDGIPDYAVFRPSTGNWYVLRSSDNGVQISQFGVNGDVPIDGDFDGDGRTDLAIYRPSAGEWWVNRSSSGAAFAVQFGQGNDRPVVGDYDKDGRSDLAFFRPSNGTWNVLRSSDGFTSYFGLPFGLSSDIPIQSAPALTK